MDVDQYISLFENFPDPIVITNAENRVLAVNLAFEQLSGYLRQEVVGENFTDLLADTMTLTSGTETAGTIDMVARLSQQKPVTFRSKSGQPYFARMRATEIHDKAGNRVASYSVLHDVSARTRFLEMFEEIHDRSKKATDPSSNWYVDILEIGCRYFKLEYGLICRRRHDGMVEILYSAGDQNPYKAGTTLPVDEGVCVRLMDSNEPLGVTTATDTSNDPACFKELAAHKSYVTAPIRIFDERHGLLVFLGNSERENPFDPLELAAAKVIARITAGRLTNQKSLRENALIADQLAESEARYKGLFRSVPAMMVYRNEEGIIEDVTDQYIERFGYSREEMAGKRIVDLVPPDSKAHTATMVRVNSRLGGKMANQPFQMLTKSGEIADIEVTAKRLEDGMVLGAVVDVSDRNRAQSELEKRNRDLERANESLKHFTSIASHDMQEPLRKIRYFSDLLQQSIQSGNQVDIDYSINVLNDAAQRASVLVSDLLEFSRASNKELERETIDLYALIEGVIAEISREKAAEAAVFSLEMPHVVVSGDRTAIIQMIRNLLGNALKYQHPKRAPFIEITADLSRDADGPATIRIKDNGIGFDPDYAEMIMKPFSRLHRRSQYPGSGVGLAICNVVAERHQWTLRAQGRPDEGATFEITIPMYFVLEA